MKNSVPGGARTRLVLNPTPSSSSLTHRLPGDDVIVVEVALPFSLRRYPWLLIVSGLYKANSYSSLALCIPSCYTATFISEEFDDVIVIEMTLPFFLSVGVHS